MDKSWRGVVTERLEKPAGVQVQGTRNSNHRWPATARSRQIPRIRAFITSWCPKPQGDPRFIDTKSSS
ncbi:hypothetical protein KQX54_019997 [Cotesia glomerata]|uniref:Uncharacterized protein n=1 Tax=Cotesia glomerata TaxID=32391 RepID=A0AAV7I0R8_COTGL|nr:hypothetical protein KQX54_019997 [Cotesia glomerata]